MADTATDETRALLTAGLDKWQFVSTDRQIEQLLTYRDLLVEWNERMNLTRLISPRDVAVEHFLDSLSLLTVLKLPKDAALLDVGAGAGFPSLPLKIMRPDLRVTLLEATAKKLTFCRAVVEATGLEDVRMIHGRAEQPHPKLERRYDLVTARAVAHLDKLIPWCTPYLKPRVGEFAALKGSKAVDETREAQATLKQFGLTARIKDVAVPGSDRTHAIVVCRQTSS